MKMCKMIALCLVAALCLGLTACKQEPAPLQQTTPAPNQENTTTPAPAQENTTTPAPVQESTTPAPTAQDTIPVDTKPVQPQERIEGTYEQWLAAASVQATTMLMYPGCEVVAIYALSETAMENKMDSKGVVLHIKDADMNMWIQSVPLAQERTEDGTRDLKAAGIGYNTYDEVDPFSISAVTQLTMDSLQPYIDQTMLPSIYER